MDGVTSTSYTRAQNTDTVSDCYTYDYRATAVPGTTTGWYNGKVWSAETLAAGGPEVDPSEDTDTPTV